MIKALKAFENGDKDSYGCVPTNDTNVKEKNWSYKEALEATL